MNIKESIKLLLTCWLSSSVLPPFQLRLQALATATAHVVVDEVEGAAEQATGVVREDEDVREDAVAVQEAVGGHAGDVLKESVTHTWLYMPWGRCFVYRV